MPPPDPRLVAVRADNPFRLNEISSGQVYAITPNASDRRFPQKLDAQRGRLIQHFLMKYGAAQSQTASTWKTCGCKLFFFREFNSPEWVPFTGFNLHAEQLESGNRIRHQSFAARLVNRRSVSIRDNDLETSTSRRYRGS